MERLTQEALKDSYVLNPQQNIPNVIVEGMIYNKLGRLEDIEEELGCPIEVLFKALNEGIYQKELYFPNVKNHLDAKYLRLRIWYNQLEWTDIWNGCNVYEFELKDYKKTWWLKEDKSE